MHKVAFMVEGVAEDGGPSGFFQEVREVILVYRPTGDVLGCYTDPAALQRAYCSLAGPLRLEAIRTVGPPRNDLVAEWVCDGQAAL